MKRFLTHMAFLAVFFVVLYFVGDMIASPAEQIIEVPDYY